MATRRRKGAPVTAKSAGLTTARQFVDGDVHVVDVKRLHVVLTPDGSHWVAQGMEIDYAAAGPDIDAAKENFSRGLYLTIKEHLKLHGTIEKLLVVAPQEIWTEYLAAPVGSLHRYSTIQTHQLLAEAADDDGEDLELPEFPDGILFIKKDKHVTA